MRKLCLLLVILLYCIQPSIKAQTNVISGIVTSADDGSTLPGVAIIVKGTTTGTTTDFDGKYTLNIPADTKVLVFSFIGMKPQEVTYTGQANINVILKSDIFGLEEVVVAGVASATPKRKLSVSVSKVGSEDLENVPATSASSALQGKVSGVTITNASGNPGESSGIRLRGATSLLGDVSPLIIVDGVMLDGGSLSDINANDIESMQVVKGASASALYGSRAGSGVIVVTTKRGSSASGDKTDIKVRNEYGMSNLVHKIDLSEHHPYRLADDYQQPTYTKYYGVIYPTGYVGGMNKNIQGTPTLDFDHYADNPYTSVKDPQDEIFKPGQYFTNYVSMAGNNVKTGFFISFENNHNSGIILNSKGSDRQNYRLNLDHKLNEYVKIKTSTLVTDVTIDKPSEGGQNSSFFNLLYMSPDANLDMLSPDTLDYMKYYIKPDPWSNGENPKHALYYEKRSTTRRGILQNFSANINPAKWINFDIDYSIEKNNQKANTQYPLGYQANNYQYKKGLIQNYAGESLSQTFQTTANMQGTFGYYTLKTKLSYLFEKNTSEYIIARASDLMTPGVTSMGIARSLDYMNSANYKTLAKDYFGILDIDYKEKLIASALYRMDGSSLFGVNNRWNPYYRFSFAYRLNEDFHIPGFQEIKLRTAVGTSGQRPYFDYQYETYLVVANTSIRKYILGNKDLKPAETKEREYAVNLQFLEHFELEIVRSKSETKDEFLKKPVSLVTGFESQWGNFATIESKTWEWTLTAQILKQKDLEWKMNFAYDNIKQKVVKLDIPPFYTGPSINSSTQTFWIKEGEPIGTMYGYDWVRSLDQMKNQLPAGKTIDNYTVNSDGYVIEKGTEGTYNEKPISIDQNNDGFADFVKIANMNPDFNLSMSSTVMWKDITFSMLWSWKQGGDIYNLTKQWIYLDRRHGDIDQSGKPDYQKKTIDYYEAFYFENRMNKHFVEDGTYLKLREMSLYYTLPADKLQKMHLPYLKHLKVGVLGRNLLTLTKYSGWDPEVASSENSTVYIIDIFNYPNFRTISASLELTF
jgi:TonB-linked SusC/RagA family outer membrane protein